MPGSVATPGKIDERTRRAWIRPTVAKKFAALLAVFLALQVLQLAVGLWRMWHVEEEAASLGLVGQLRPAALAVQARRLSSAEPSARLAQRQALLEAIETQDGLYRRLASLYRDKAGERLYAELVHRINEAVSLWQKGLSPLLRDLAASTDPASPAARAALSQYEALFPHQAEQLREIAAQIEWHLQEEIGVAFRQYLLVFLLALFFALVVAGVICRQIFAPLQALEAASRSLGAGDFTSRVAVRSRDEFGTLAGAFNDMATSLERQATRLASLQRVYLMISRINGAIVRVREREVLLSEACRIAVEAGGFRLAWIGFPDQATGMMRVVAAAGAAQGYLEGLRISLEADLPEGRGPTATAFRTGETQFCNDIAQEARMAPWRDRAQAFGLRASIALPLRSQGRIVGVFNLYSARAGVFDHEERRLLEELAADVALGLEHIAQAEELGRIANYDTLTGLPNHNLFADRLAQALARAGHTQRVLAVLVARLENLRSVTTVLGRHMGDALLQAIAAHLAGALRPGDTVARLSGANFALLLTDLARPEDVLYVANRLLDGLPKTITIGETEIVPALSIGVAVYPEDGEDGETLLRHAELALQDAAKKPLASAATVRLAFYSPTQGAQARERLRLEQALPGALARGEFALHYQPIVTLESGRLRGFEALARWTHPEFGPVPPDRFIPLAESNGFILSLGEWVLETACRQVMHWVRAGYTGLRVAVNVSAQQLHDPAFVTRVESVLQKTGFETRQAQLALEITESGIMPDPEGAIAVLSRLKALGLLIYVDDFGSGYSSLSYLYRLPVDVLKIDRSFVRDLGQAAEARAVVKAILALASALGLEVVAEGIETATQHQQLLALGCRLGQGYLFGRPQPAEACEELLKAAAER